MAWKGIDGWYLYNKNLGKSFESNSQHLLYKDCLFGFYSL